jgi:hypothetical protein
MNRAARAVLVLLGIFVLPALGRFHPAGLNPVIAYSGQRVVTVQHVFVTSMKKIYESGSLVR